MLIKEVNNIVPYNWEVEDYIDSKTIYEFIHLDCGKTFKSL